MDRLLRRVLLATLALILLLGLGFYSYHSGTTKHRLQVSQAHVESTFQGVSQGFQEFADVVAEWVLSDATTRALISQTSKDDPVARGLLYRRMFPLYESLRAKHVRQLHVVGGDGRSLLRMHAPERSGDDLRTISPLKMQAIDQRKRVSGFENGRVMSGFRHVYPVQDGSVLLGALEVGLSFIAIHHLMAKELGEGTVVRFLLERSDLLQAMGGDSRSNQTLFASLYEPSPVHPAYVTENLAQPLFDTQPEVLPAYAMAVEQHAGENASIRKAIERGQAFSHMVCISLGECYLVSGLPVKNSRDAVAGYVLAYSQDAGYASNAASVLIAFLLSSLLLVALALVGLRQLRTSRRLVALSEHVHKGIYVLDRVGRITYVNPAACALLGYAQDELMGGNAHVLFHASSAGEQVAPEDCPIRLVTQKGVVFQGDAEVFRAKDGTLITVEVTSSPITEAGEVTSVVTVFTDIRERLRRDERMRQSDAALLAAAEGVMITDADERIVAVNPAFTHMTGYEGAEVLGRKPGFLASGKHPKEFYEAMWAKLNSEGIWQGEIYNRRKDGSVFPEWLSISKIRDSAGRVTSYVGVFNDISEIKDKEDKLSFMAHYDVLTKLPNRRLLHERLDQALRHKQREEGLLGVLFIDIDRFKQVNDSLGHDAGDRLICEAAERIYGILRREDTLARQGGDEFVILLDGMQEAQAASLVADKVIAAFKPAFHLPGFEEQAVFVGASVGISLYPQDGHDVSNLLKQADAAMYEAKAAGGNAWRFSNPEMTSVAVQRLRLEGELRHALEAGEFTLYYQPKVKLSDGHIYGLEALIRWQHPTRGLLGPYTFLPTAQESRLIADIGAWVVQEAARQIAIWQEAGLPPVKVCVNIDGAQLARGDLADVVEAALAESALEPHWLGLEITETAIMAQAEGVIRSLETLRALGIGMSIDDFGTGHSSLSRLKQLPVKVLKIDASFVRDMVEDASDRAIVRATVALAKALGLSTVAEGVETAAQLAMLKAMGCDAIQGYYLSRPVPAESVPALLAQGGYAAQVNGSEGPDAGRLE